MIGAQPPWLPLRGSWHGEAVTEEAFPAAAGDSPCHCVALPPHKCGGQGLSFRCTFHPGDSHAGLITGSEWPVMGAQFPRLSLWGSAYERTVASLDKGTHARRTFRRAFRCVIVLDLRQQACVLCLAKTAPERPAGLRVFPEDKRQPARQTRQMG